MIGAEHTVNRKACIACGECVQNCPTGALEICGKDMSIDEIMDIVKKDLAFYGERGGITLSGGEPFAQSGEVLMLLSRCKSEGISTAIETCGYGDREAFLSAVQHVDIFLWDVKDTDSERPFRYTGVSNDTIIFTKGESKVVYP